jgi:hypothetical protein
MVVSLGKELLSLGSPERTIEATDSVALTIRNIHTELLFANLTRPLTKERYNL